MRNAFNYLFVDQFPDPVCKRVPVYLERHFADDDLSAVAFLADVGAGAQRDPASPGAVTIENALPAATNGGRGLYKQIEHENDANIVDAKERINKYRSDAEKNSKDFEKAMDQYQKDLVSGGAPAKPTPPKLRPAPEIATATRIPDNLSNFVDFLHPWGGHLTNLGVLLTMLIFFLGATGIALRAQDIG